MPLHEVTRKNIEAKLGGEQVAIHEELHDAIDQATTTYHEAAGRLREQRRDEVNAAETRFHEEFSTVHSAYEQACQRAHVRANEKGYVPLSSVTDVVDEL